MARGEVRYRLTLDSNIKAETEKGAQALAGLGTSFNSTTAKAGAMADTIGRVSTTMARSADAFGLPAKALRTLDDVMDIAEIGFGNLSKSAAGFNAASIGVAGAGLAVGSAIGSWLNTFPKVRGAVDGLRDSLLSLVNAQTAASKNSQAMAGMSEFQAKMAKSHEEAVNRQIARQLALGRSIEDIQKMYKQVERPAKTAAQIVDELAEKHKKAEAATKKHTEAMSKLAEEQKRAAQEIAKDVFNRGVGGGGMAGIFGLGGRGFAHADLVGAKQADPVQELGLGPNFGHLLTRQFGTFAASAGKQFKLDFGAAMEGLGGVILGAIQGGGSVTGAVGAHLGGSLATDLTKGLSGTLGKLVGSLAGPLGTLLGGGVGKLFGGLFGGGEGAKVNDMRDQFISAAGGLDALNKKAHEAGMTLDALLRADKVSEFESAVASLTGAIDFQSRAQKELNAAAEKYGFHTQNQIDMMAGQLIKEWELLTANQFGSAEVAQAMADNVNEFLQTTKQVPANMKPVLDQMLQLGLLTDESGNAFSSLEEAGITFTDSLSTGLQAIVEEIRKLREALTGVRDVANGINVGGGGGGAHVPGGFRGGEQLEGFAEGTDGFQNFGKGTPAVLHGNEAVMTPGGLSEMADMVAARVGGHMVLSGGNVRVDLVRGVLEMVADGYRTNEGGLRQTIRQDLGMS